MSTFRNLNELYMIWEKPTQSAIAYVTNKMIETIQDQIDRKGIGYGGEWYEPSGQFKEAFRDELATRIGNYITGFVKYDPYTSGMTFDVDKWQHGSPISGDSIEGLAEIIFEGESGHIFGKGFWTEPRDAWNSAGDIITKSISKWFKEGFSLSGIKLKNNI